MQIHEVTKNILNEAVPGIGGLVTGGMASLMGRAAGQQTATQVSAANQAQIDKVATKAYPMWQAKRMQLEKTMGMTADDFDEELEAWIEDNVLRGNYKIDQMDPRYQTQIKTLINQVNNIQDDATRLAKFKQLIATAVLARPARRDVAVISQQANATQAINIALGIARAMTAGERFTPGQVKNMLGGGIAQVPMMQIARQVGADTDAEAVATILKSANIQVS